MPVVEELFGRSSSSSPKIGCVGSLRTGFGAVVTEETRLPRLLPESELSVAKRDAVSTAGVLTRCRRRNI